MKKLQNSKKEREQFKLEQKWAVRQRDFYRAILDTQPQICYFSCHVTGEDGIVLEDEVEQSAPLLAKELAGLTMDLFQTTHKQTVVTLIGASGSGKSSVVFAGLIPRLRDEGIWLIESLRILDDVGQEPGNLPLLEFALTQLWSKQNDNELTHKAYDEIGGIKQALLKHAESIYNKLSDTQQKHLLEIGK